MHCGAPLPPPNPLPAGASFSQAEAYYTGAAERLRATVVELSASLAAPSPASQHASD